MPMASAYARTLIKQGKAHLQSHPALPVLVLSRTVAAPTLRPILLGLVLRPSTATVYIFTETHGTTPLLTVIIDLLEVSQGDRPIAIHAVIDRLHAALPINTIAIANPPELVEPDLRTTIDDLAMRLPIDGYAVSLVKDKLHNLPTVPHLLTNAFLEGMNDPRFATASPPLVAQYRHALATRTPPATPASLEHLVPEMVVQVQQAKHMISGVVQKAISDRTLTIAVACINRAPDPVTIQWQQQIVPVGAIHAWWAAEPVLLLPTGTGYEDGYGQSA